MQFPDFSALTALQFVIVLLAVGLFDMFTGVTGALRSGTFDAAKLLDVLESHGERRVMLIGLLFAIGQVSGVVGLCWLADAALAAYVAETVISSVDNLHTTPPPAA